VIPSSYVPLPYSFVPPLSSYVPPLSFVMLPVAVAFIKQFRLSLSSTILFTFELPFTFILLFYVPFLSFSPFSITKLKASYSIFICCLVAFFALPLSLSCSLYLFYIFILHF
jgi:hypothetical protein